jgi:predicted ATPase
MATGTSYRTPGTLPPQTSGFVGRAAELARARDLLRQSRLVTVTGPGGVGKTRLAVRAAGEAAGGFRDGAHIVELSAVHDAGLLAHTLAARLTMAELSNAASDEGSQLDRLLGFLRERELLLILDTCEHLVDACAALAGTILGEAPGVTILATSRQPLDASGEALLQLCPLPVPDPSEDSAGKADAVELFAQRAAATVPGFRVTQENLADVITVCRRLDGIPLAIELATVRLRALPLREMAELIDDRLRLLTGGRRSGTPRHQTLRATIEWSYSLCTPAEQLLWARLSVFAGGFDMAAAEEVCAGGALAITEIAPAVINLVDKNVVVRGDSQHASAQHGAAGQHRAAGQPGAAGHPAFLLPDTLREFGSERLHQAELEPADAHLAGPYPAGAHPATPRTVSSRLERLQPPVGGRPTAPDTAGHAEATVRSRFVAYYLALAERFEQAPVAGQAAQYQRLRREHANLRAAFDYALELPGNDGAAVALATSLFVYWQVSGLLREAEYWLDQAAERCPERSAARARVLATRGYVRVLLGDFAGGRADA